MTSTVSEVHSLKSALAKPVVVIADTELKTPSRSASPAVRTSALISSTTTITDARATTASPMRNSSSRANTRGRRATRPA